MQSHQRPRFDFALHGWLRQDRNARANLNRALNVLDVVERVDDVDRNFVVLQPAVDLTANFQFLRQPDEVLAFQVGILHDYQLLRIDTWLESWGANSLIAGRNGPAFHTYHARVAIGNGEWLGTGLGQGVANEAAHLPERDCDSIFAVAAEETGFLGGLGLILLYALLIVLIFNSASQVRERFSRLVVGGIGIYFASHLFVNVGVNLGLVPMTGLTLPLLSTGGSSLTTSLLALGLALGLSSHHEPSLDKDDFTR